MGFDVRGEKSQQLCCVDGTMSGKHDLIGVVISVEVQVCKCVCVLGVCVCLTAVIFVANSLCCKYILNFKEHLNV